MFSTPTFSTLESTWDQSARRGWTTIASFTMQAFGLSLLLAIPLISVQRPPRVHWLQLAAPAALTPPAASQAAHRHLAAATVSNLFRGADHRAPIDPFSHRGKRRCGFGSARARAARRRLWIRSRTPRWRSLWHRRYHPGCDPRAPSRGQAPADIALVGGQPPAPGAADLSAYCAPGARSGRGRVAGDYQQGGDDREFGRGPRTPAAGRRRDCSGSAMALPPLPAE